MSDNRPRPREVLCADERYSKELRERYAYRRRAPVMNMQEVGLARANWSNQAGKPDGLELRVWQAGNLGGGCCRPHLSSTRGTCNGTTYSDITEFAAQLNDVTLDASETIRQDDVKHMALVVRTCGYVQAIDAMARFGT